MVTLISLPSDIFSHLFFYLKLSDFSALHVTCKNIKKETSQGWKRIFLNSFDPCPHFYRFNNKKVYLELAVKVFYYCLETTFPDFFRDELYLQKLKHELSLQPCPLATSLASTSCRIRTLKSQITIESRYLKSTVEMMPELEKLMKNFQFLSNRNCFSQTICSLCQKI